MLQNVEIPKRFGDSNTDIMAAKSLPIEAPRGGTEHQIQLAEIHLGEAALQYQSRPTTSLSTAYRHKAKAPKNRVTKVYSCRRCGEAKSARTGHRQRKGDWFCPSVDGAYEEWVAACVK